MNGGDYLYLARTRAGLTQAELAERSGRRQSEIARIETGRVHPAFETIRDLVRACGLEMEISFAAADSSYRTDVAERLAQAPAERVKRGLRLARQIQRLRRTTLTRAA